MGCAVLWSAAPVKPLGNGPCMCTTLLLLQHEAMMQRHLMRPCVALLLLLQVRSSSASMRARWHGVQRVLLRMAWICWR